MHNKLKSKDSSWAFAVFALTSSKPTRCTGICSKSFPLRFDAGSPGLFADVVAGLTQADGKDLQQLLETRDLKERLVLALGIVRKELEITKVYKEVAEKVDEDVTAAAQICHGGAVPLLEEGARVRSRRKGGAHLDQQFRERLATKNPARSGQLVEQELSKSSHLCNSSTLSCLISCSSSRSENRKATPWKAESRAILLTGSPALPWESTARRITMSNGHAKS